MFGNGWRTVVYVLLHDCVNARVCNLHSLHHTGHIGSFKLHTVLLRSVALLLSHSVLVQFFGWQTQAGWWCLLLGSGRSLSCSFTISAEIWSLNGKTTRTVSSVSLPGDKGLYWSQTFESTKLLMIELTRFLGNFKR